MEKIIVPTQFDLPLDRIYIVAATLKTFKGRRHVDVQVFRPNGSDEEMEALRGLGLVAPPDPSIPPEVLQGATEEAALRCILEAFTAEEIAAEHKRRRSNSVKHEGRPRYTCMHCHNDFVSGGAPEVPLCDNCLHDD